MKLGTVTAIAALVFGGAFAIGALLGGRTNRSELGASAMDQGDHPRKPLTALMATGSGSGAQIDELLSTHRSSFSSSIRAIARLIRETELDDLPALVRNLENDLPVLHREMVRELLNRRLQREEPAALLEILAQHPEIGHRMVNAILGVSVTQTPDQTFAMIESEQSPKRRRELREAALRVEISQNPQSAIDRIAKLSAEPSDKVANTFVTRWVRADQEAAAGDAGGRFEANDGFREDMRWCLPIAIDRWCSLDADGPAALYKQRFDKNFRGSGLQLELAIYSIAFASAQGQPFDQEKAAAIFADLPFPISLGDLPKYASIGIATRSLAEALRSYREFSVERVHDEFFNLAKLGSESPAAVIEEIAQFETEKDRSRLQLRLF